MSADTTSCDLGAWKSRIAEARDALAWAPENGSALVTVVDSLVQELGRAAGWDERGRALVALGGYGRGELAPRSDVDLLFLVRRGPEAGDVNGVLYPLWDLGFEVGHALRTPADCAALAASDLTAATAFLDARVLMGDEELFYRARRRAGLRPGGSREMRRWIPRILEDVQARRARFGEISHLLEPHVKEGRGGLRDLQASRWVLACLGERADETIRELSRGGEVFEAERFLNRTRNALHAAAGRKTDHLTFEYHRDVADQVMPGEPIEAFFEALHRAGHKIVAVWEEVAARARQALLPRRKRSILNEPLPSATLISGELLRWCRAGDELPEELRYTLVRGDRGVVREALKASVSTILHNRIALKPLLQELHRLELSGLIAPDLEAVAHQVHYDARHAFTTGIHCIETLGAFEDLWLGAHEKDEPHLTRIAGAVLNPGTVRLAALCHDLGKVGGVDDHVGLGAHIARRMALDLGFHPDEANEAARLVSAHHVIPEIAFGEDLEDRASWERARDAAGSAAAVDALVALAFADLVATHPGNWVGVWSDWKRDLLLSLHARAQGLEEPDLSRGGRLRKAVEAGAGRGDLAQLDDVWDRIPPRQALQLPPDLLARLLILAENLEDSPARWSIEARRGGVAEVLGVVQPMPRVLSSSAGCLTRLGFDVLSFQVHTWAEGTAHLWFRVAHKRDLPPLDRVTSQLTRAVTGEERPEPKPTSSLHNPRDEAIPVETRVRILPEDNPFYTVLEVRCRDRRGLIRDLTRVFEDLGLTVEYALVTTHGPMAQDVFHLKDIFGGRIEGADKVRALLSEVDRVAGARMESHESP